MKERSSRLRAAAAYAPLVILTLVTAIGWGVYRLGGGFASILGWLAVMQLVPLLALFVIGGTIVAAIVTRRKPLEPGARRRRRARRLATFALGAFCLWPFAWSFNVLTLRFPYEVSDTRPAVTARLPTDAPMRVAWGGDRLEGNAHASTPDQRWAYDLLIEPALAGSTRLEDYGCFGVPVVAPVSGVVRVAHDGEPDVPVTPGRHEPNYTVPLGNHVAIAVDGGGYLIVAHLKNGSVVAREGERVREGAPLGACGNSGNTTEPHVHIHAQRQDPRGRPLNFSEGLPLFLHRHDGEPMPRGGIEQVGDRQVATGAVVRHIGDTQAPERP